MSLAKSIRQSLSLYIGKLGGVAATLVFVPLFRRLFSAEDFGWISIVLSLQTIIYALDFGLAPHLSRRASRLSQDPSSMRRFGKQMGLAALTIRLSYLILSLFFICCFLIFDFKWNFLFGGLLLLCLGFQTEMNLLAQVLLGMKQYDWSSYLQLFSALFRGFLSFVFVKACGANVTYFLAGQIIAAYFAQWLAQKVLISRGVSIRFEWALQTFVIGLNKKRTRQWYSLLAKSWPLFLAVAVGALTTQADRLVIATFISPATAGDYFVALTFALTPVLIVAQPVFQFFQPQINSTLNTVNFNRPFRCFCVVLHFVIYSAATCLFLMTKELFQFWLHIQDVDKLVWLARILMSGASLAAYAFMSYSLLLANGQYKDLKLISITASTVYFLLLYLSGSAGSVVFVAVSFVVFNLLAYVMQLYKSRNIWMIENKKLVLRFFFLSIFLNVLALVIPEDYYQGPFWVRLTILGLVELGLAIALGLFIRGCVVKRDVKR